MIEAELEPVSLPDGYRAVPLRIEDSGAPLAVCVLARKGSSQSPPFILLRETIDASIYLGCVVDAAGHPKSWLEIWVQNVDRVASNLQSKLEPLSNAVLDRRWADRLSLFRSLDRSTLIETKWQTARPAPTFIDPKQGCVVPLIEPATNRPLMLCTDEDALGSANLPSYASSLCRFLWTGPGAAEPVFLAAAGNAPLPPGMRSVLSLFVDLLPFNPGAGLLLVRRMSPLEVAELADVLGGKPWPGLKYHKARLDIGRAYSGLEDIETLIQQGAHLFSGRNGRSARLLEVFHLKLNLIFQCLFRIQSATRIQQLPFLSLNAGSFKVRLAETGTGLPFFWTAHVDLVESSSAVELVVEAKDGRYFLAPESSVASIYRPQRLSLRAQGQATVRIRKILPPSAEGSCLEATLASDERLDVAASDLIHVRLPLPGSAIDLYGRIDESEALATGEARFRTLPQNLSQELRNELERVAGAPIAHTRFEVLPLLSSPCDMYALAVIAVRILLVNHENTLAIALDEMLSLAHQLASQHCDSVPFDERLAKVIETDPRWNRSLGPQRLSYDPDVASIASRVIPPELWWQTLGLVTRLFPGAGPDSFCRDFGDAPSQALHRIFEKPIDRLEALQRRSKSLVLPDWNQNLEIHDAIYAVVAKQHRNQTSG